MAAKGRALAVACFAGIVLASGPVQATADPAQSWASSSPATSASSPPGVTAAALAKARLPPPPPLPASAKLTAVRDVLKQVISLSATTTLTAAQPNDAKGDYLAFLNNDTYASQGAPAIELSGSSESGVLVTLTATSGVYLLDVAMSQPATVSYLIYGITPALDLTGTAPAQSGHALIVVQVGSVGMPATPGIYLSCPSGAGCTINSIEISPAQ